MAKNDKQDIRYLVRIASTDLPGEKPIAHALTRIKGVSVAFAFAAVRIAKLDPQVLTGKLTDKQVETLSQIITKPLDHGVPSWMCNHQRDYETGEDMHLITADLDLVKQNDIKRMMKTKSYIGLRHAWGLTLRGQRTKANFRRSKAKAAAASKKRGGQ